MFPNILYMTLFGEQFMNKKTKIFTRVPPGDRWVVPDAGYGVERNRIHPSLTDALEHYFQEHGARQYYIDAAEGSVYVVDTVEPPTPPIQKYSIYDDY